MQITSRVTQLLLLLFIIRSYFPSLSSILSYGALTGQVCSNWCVHQETVTSPLSLSPVPCRRRFRVFYPSSCRHHLAWTAQEDACALKRVFLCHSLGRKLDLFMTESELRQHLQKEYRRARSRILRYSGIHMNHHIISQEFRHIEPAYQRLVNITGKQKADAIMCDISLGVSEPLQRRSILERLRDAFKQWMSFLNDSLQHRVTPSFMRLFVKRLKSIALRSGL
jgi:hypothetical protein